MKADAVEKNGGETSEEQEATSSFVHIYSKQGSLDGT